MHKLITWASRTSGVAPLCVAYFGFGHIWYLAVSSFVALRCALCVSCELTLYFDATLRGNSHVICPWSVSLVLFTTSLVFLYLRLRSVDAERQPIWCRYFKVLDSDSRREYL